MTVMMTALFMVISLVSTACYCLPISRSWTPLEADVCNPFLDTRMLWALSYMNVSMDICIAMFPILSLMDMQNPGKRGSLGSVIMMTILNATPAIMAVYRYLLMMNHLSMDGISGTGPASTVAFSSTGEMLCLLAATFFPTSKLLGQRLWEIRGPKIEKTIIWMFLVAIWDTIKWYFAKLFPTKQDLEDLDEKDSGDESKRDSQHSEDPPSPTGSKSNLSKSVSQTSQMQTPVRIWSNRISRRIGWTSSHINSSDQSINIALTSLNPNTSNRNQRMSRGSTYPVMNEEQPSGIPRYFEFNPVQSTESVNGLRSLPSPVPFKSGHRRREYSIDHTNTGSEGRVEPSTTI
ncbi:hypothetical protein BZA77DRAFT_313253 [Pyronema omphalodes]|nr:hypothetical protein BZA77DRAFT_313253 [Pyronema omphalodes]